MAPRSPARRGTQASRAPVREASPSADDRAPGEVASRSPTMITEVESSGWSPVMPSASSAAASSPGAVGMSVPPILRSPREV